MNIYKKFAKAKYDFHHTEVKKTGRNKFANYDYLQLADFTKVLVSLLNDNGLTSLVSFTEELATLTIIETETGETMEVTSPMSTASLKGCHEVQNLGAVQTYIRRYLYCAAFDIVEGDALDGSKPLEPKKPTNIKCGDLIIEGAKNGYTSHQIEASLKKSYGVGMEFITQEQHDEALAKIKKAKHES